MRAPTSSTVLRRGKSILAILVMAACGVELNERPKAVPDAGTGGHGGAGGGGGSAGHAGTSGADAAQESSAGSGGAPDASPDAPPETGGGFCSGPVPEPGAPPRLLELHGHLGIHDPSIVEAPDGYYIFSTGVGVQVRKSEDLSCWVYQAPVFERMPAWIAQRVPRARDFWAPDVAFFSGKYHLYYSVSSFGSRQSCIGHATADSLAGTNFTDHGPVICSQDSDSWNAIDANVILDESGNAWMSFGSFWEGIKLIALDADGARLGDTFIALASRPEEEAIEAPYIVRHGAYFYLFVSFDRCCRGASSSYNIRVGRSADVAGPYVDAQGNPLMNEGGTLLVSGDERWRGPGHNSVLLRGETGYLVYHAYDANQNGAPMLRISEFVWEDGWPRVVGP